MAPTAMPTKNTVLIILLPFIRVPSYCHSRNWRAGLLLDRPVTPALCGGDGRVIGHEQPTVCKGYYAVVEVGVGASLKIGLFLWPEFMMKYPIP